MKIYRLLFGLTLSLSVLCTQLHSEENVIYGSARGGLGNQMTVIAGVSAIAWKHGYEAVFEDKQKYVSRIGSRSHYWGNVLWKVRRQSFHGQSFTYHFDFPNTNIDFTPVKDVFKNRSFF